MTLGPQSPSDSAFAVKCRLLQSRYRAEVLKEPFGIGPSRNSKKKDGTASYYGNMLVDGELSGSNFITPVAFDFAKEKVRQKRSKENPFLTIDEYRLFNNMLSSMPMYFNLFSDLRKLLGENQPEA